MYYTTYRQVKVKGMNGIMLSKTNRPVVRWSKTKKDRTQENKPKEDES